VALDTLQSRERLVTLLERYGPLLTDHQRQVMDLHVRQDWSLSEVAHQQDISRAAVHDLVRRATQALEDFEQRLGLIAERDRRRQELDDIKRRLAALVERL